MHCELRSGLQDTGLDLSVLAEVAGEPGPETLEQSACDLEPGTAAAEEWQQQEDCRGVVIECDPACFFACKERAAPLLQFLRQMLLQLMQGSPAPAQST